MDDPAETPRGGASCGVIVLALVGGFVVLVFVVALAVPFFMPGSRSSNTRNASATLKTITTAQADFRANDRDNNLVNDYWTADVYGLYALVPVLPGATAPPPDTADAMAIIKLIEPSTAGADGLSRTELYGNIRFDACIISGSPKAGHVYRMFGRDGTVVLAEDTDGPALYGAAHSRNRFACAAMPDTFSAGNVMYLVNADNTIWRHHLPATYRLEFAAIEGTSDSTSTVTGTGHSGFDFAGPGTGVFPANPAATGCSKMD